MDIPAATRSQGLDIEAFLSSEAAEHRDAFEAMLRELAPPFAAGPFPSGRANADIRKRRDVWPTGPDGIAPAATLQVPFRWNTWSSHFFLKVQP